MKDDQPLFSRQMLRQSLRLMQPVRKLMWPMVVLIAIVQLLQLGTPYILKMILDELARLNAIRWPALYGWIAGAFALSLAASGMKLWRDRVVFDFLLRMERHLPVEAQDKLMRLSLGYHEKHDTGNTVTKVLRGSDRFIDMLANIAFEFLPTILQTIATCIVLAWVEWRIALIFGAIIPPFFVLTYWMNKRVRPLRERRFRGYERAGGQMAQSLINIHTVQSFAQGNREVDNHRAIRQDVYITEGTEWRHILACNFWRDTLINIGRIAVLLYAVWLIAQKECGIGSLVLFLTWSEQAYNALFRISRLFDRAAEWAEAITRLTKVLDEPITVCDTPDAAPLGSIAGSVSFKNVSFAYHGNHRNALHDVSLIIPAGTTTAFVGPSGCGKTTAVKLLFRHYNPCSGVVAIDGNDLARATAESFRRQMAIVPQEVEIFSLTIRDNIAYAQPDATMEGVIAAAQLANAHSFIQSLPHGYNTQVGERGLKLSGGQRQRIGIARALLPNPRILVFDEATSSLDSESEALIQQSLRTISLGRTTIIIAHRLSTIRHADQIVVFDKGRIVDTGTHDELLEHKTLYRRLHDIQSRGHVLSTSTKPLTS